MRVESFSFVSRLLDAVLNKTVIGVLITTVIGSLGVAMVTTSVTRSLGERNLQFEAISALMDFTKDANFDDSNQILKLQALIGLIKENRELSVNVDGFDKIVKEFQDAEIKKLEKTAIEEKKKVSELKETEQKLTSELSKTKAEFSEDAEKQAREVLELEDKIKEAETALTQATGSLEEKLQALEEAKGVQVGSEMKLTLERQKVKDLELALGEVKRAKVGSENKLTAAIQKIDGLQKEIQNITLHQKTVVLKEGEEKPEMHFNVQTDKGSKRFSFKVEATNIGDIGLNIKIGDQSYRMKKGEKHCAGNTPFSIEVVDLINLKLGQTDLAIIRFFYTGSNCFEKT